MRCADGRRGAIYLLRQRKASSVTIWVHVRRRCAGAGPGGELVGGGRRADGGRTPCFFEVAESDLAISARDFGDLAMLARDFSDFSDVSAGF